MSVQLRDYQQNAVEAVRQVGIENRADFYWALHAVFVNRRDQHDIFDQAFHIFWRDPDLLGRVMSMMLPKLKGRHEAPPPPETALGALYRHVTRPRGPGEVYEPAAITHGLLPALPGRPGKRERRRLHLERALQAFAAWEEQSKGG